MAREWTGSVRGRVAGAKNATLLRRWPVTMGCGRTLVEGTVGGGVLGIIGSDNKRFRKSVMALDCALKVNKLIMQLFKGDRCFTSTDGSSDLFEVRAETVEDMDHEIIIGYRRINESKFVSKGFDGLKKFHHRFGITVSKSEPFLETHDPRASTVCIELGKFVPSGFRG